MALVDQQGNREQRRARQRLTPLEGSPADAAEIPGWSGRIMVWLRVAAQLVVIQLLMILGTALGLGLLGLGPAAVAGSTLLRRIVDGDPSDQLWKDFWGIYRAQFRRAAAVTVPFILVIAMSWYEVLILLVNSAGSIGAILIGAVLAVGGYAVACLAYAPHVLRRYTDPIGPSLRFVAVSALLSPLTAVGCILTAVALTVVGIKFLPVLILAGLSIPLLLTGLLVDRWLDRIDARAASA
ncbi:YesL family protein [Demequina sp. NBRC 110054]|uniref:YesL family protein n=1 Tax=Demequina sp. NBRC 110054 TaxID=1570343 RepID=UPI0013564EF3|nr:DUF624 domain-containing protein [Demequina sp. NBRC 110054]